MQEAKFWHETSMDKAKNEQKITFQIVIFPCPILSSEEVIEAAGNLRRPTQGCWCRSTGGA